jgi:VacB/RNase II family 3'-5' exoribonuclease
MNSRNGNNSRHRSYLQHIANRAMLERGLLPEFSSEALAELERILGRAQEPGRGTRDLRHLPWCSIDNDDSRDLDQLTAAEVLAGEAVRVFVAIADVDGFVKKGSAIDSHARQNTTSVYTEAKTFPMLPEKLSTDLTSLNFGIERHALVVEMVVDQEGSFRQTDVYPALVQNLAKLAYRSVAAWLEGIGPMPEAIRAVPGLAENLRLQDRAAQEMKQYRHKFGALTLETIEARMVFDGDELKAMEAEGGNRARDIIENFMIAANGVTARFLTAKNLPSLRRVVRAPQRWDRIREIAVQHGSRLPEEPNARSLERFLWQARADDPLRFPDLSLSVIKLMGPGQYEVQAPGGGSPGHFGLAVRDYAHSTAPNRRFPDVITQRLLKAAFEGTTVPYELAELEQLAQHCTEKEDAARKVERQVKKSAAAMLLQPRIGEEFDAIVTGSAAKGTWVRLLRPPIEGKLATGSEGIDVGDRVRVRLVRTEVERGYIDFKRVQ